MNIHFEINGKEWKISGLTISDYYHINDELVLNPHAAFSITSYLSGCPEALLKEIDVEAWNALWSNVQAFVKWHATQNLQLKSFFKHESTKYFLIDSEEMSIGEFADLDIMINSPGSDKKLHEVMAILYRPKSGDEIAPYDVKTFKERAEAFKLLPLQTAMAALSFFTNSGVVFLNNTLDFLRQIREEMTTPEDVEIIQQTINLLQEAGSRLSSLSQEKIHSKWTELPDSLLKAPSIGLRISRTDKESKNSKPKKFYTNISLN